MTRCNLTLGERIRVAREVFGEDATKTLGNQAVYAALVSAALDLRPTEFHTIRVAAERVLKERGTEAVTE